MKQTGMRDYSFPQRVDRAKLMGICMNVWRFILASLRAIVIVVPDQEKSCHKGARRKLVLRRKKSKVEMKEAKWCFEKKIGITVNT